MSYDITFTKDGEPCLLPFPTPHGGTYCASDKFCEAWLNITFNYYPKNRLKRPLFFDNAKFFQKQYIASH